MADRWELDGRWEGGRVSGRALRSERQSLAAPTPRRQSSSTTSRSPGVGAGRNRRAKMRVPDAYVELKEEKVRAAYREPYPSS